MKGKVILLILIFLQKEFDSELSSGIFPHSPTHSDGVLESSIDSISCDAARVLASADKVGDGGLSGGGGQLVDDMEESGGKQYFSDISHFCSGLAMKRVLSESAFSIYDHYVSYHFNSLCVIKIMGDQAGSVLSSFKNSRLSLGANMFDCYARGREHVHGGFDGWDDDDQGDDDDRNDDAPDDIAFDDAIRDDGDDELPCKSCCIHS